MDFSRLSELLDTLLRRCEACRAQSFNVRLGFGLAFNTPGIAKWFEAADRAHPNLLFFLTESAPLVSGVLAAKGLPWSAARAMQFLKDRLPAVRALSNAAGVDPDHTERVILTRCTLPLAAPPASSFVDRLSTLHEQGRQSLRS